MQQYTLTSTSKWIKHQAPRLNLEKIEREQPNYSNQDPSSDSQTVTTVYTGIYCQNYLSLVGHDQRELGVHGSIPNKDPVLDCIVFDEVSPPVSDQSTEEHPQRVFHSNVRDVPVVFQDMKLVSGTLEINFSI